MTPDLEPVPPYTPALPTCPECGTGHDPRPCAGAGSVCDCCAAMYAGPDARQADADILDQAEGIARALDALPPRPPALDPVTCGDLLPPCTHDGPHVPVGLDGRPA